MKKHVERNRQILQALVLPTLLLTVTLLGGLRIDATSKQFVFLAPPLVTLILAALLASLFVRARAIEIQRWLNLEHPLLTNIGNLFTLLALFFASAQAFNSVLPESGLLHWMFCFFFLWTLWTNQFALFDSKRLFRSLIVLFATAFILKHLLVAGLHTEQSSWLSKLAGAVLEGVSVTGPSFAPATGYISFFTLALYVVALLLITPAGDLTEKSREGIASRDDSHLLAGDVEGIVEAPKP